MTDDGGPIAADLNIDRCREADEQLVLIERPQICTQATRVLVRNERYDL